MHQGRTRSLEIRSARADGSCLIRLDGELDLAGADGVDAALRQAIARDGRVFVDIDLLTFIDSTGLQAFLRAKRDAESAGTFLRFTRGRGHVADAFRLTALSETLGFVDADDPRLAPLRAALDRRR